jgi:tRNA(Ile)-lysidine synthase
MEARKLRYQWFAQRCQALDAEAICVAHHKDDQAETLLLNLIRGTGLKGLSAMHPDREINGLRIIRPLLDITRKDIIQYLSAIGQTFVTDSTNLERDALRNRIRLDLMPMLQQLNPNITECLARTAHNVRMELDPASEEGYYHIWLAPLGFSRSQILDIYAHRPTTQPLTTQNSTNNAPPLRSGLMWHSSTHTLLLNRGEWILQKRGDSNKSQAELLIENLPTGSFPTAKDFLQKEQAFIDAHSIRGKLILRPIRQGDRFQPYGMKHGTKLVSDYLTDRKVSLLEKSQQLVAIDSATDSIVWLVGREIDHNYRIDHSSTNILRLRIISKSC